MGGEGRGGEGRRERRGGGEKSDEAGRWCQQRENVKVSLSYRLECGGKIGSDSQLEVVYEVVNQSHRMG